MISRGGPVYTVRWTTAFLLGCCSLLWRYFSGAHLDGQPRTDAGFLRRGTMVVPPAVRASRWCYLPRYQRALIRVGGPVVALTLWGMYLHHPVRVQVLAALVIAFFGFRALARGQRLVKDRRFRAFYLRPLAAVLGPVLGTEHMPVDQWLVVSKELPGLMPRLAKRMSPAEVAVRKAYGTHVEPVLRWLPERVMRVWWWLVDRKPAKAAKAAVVWFHRPREDRGARVEVRTSRLVDEGIKGPVRTAIKAKLGLASLDEWWDQVGPVATGIWTVRKELKEKVFLKDIVEYFDTIKEHEFVVGLDRNGVPVVLNLDDDSPHIACSAGSGAGKSVLAMLIAVQVLRRGGRVIILDRKGSHRWALDLPGVTYCHTVEQMHPVLIEAAEEAERRNRESVRHQVGWDPGPRILVIFEEMNATSGRLRAYWEKIKEKGDQKASPAVEGYQEISFMGRSAKTNLFAVAQMLTARASGGPEARESFGIRCLARYTVNAWRMLVPECAMPKSSRTRGRWQIVVGGVATETQVAFLTDAQARELAMQRVVGAAPVPVSPAPETVSPEQVSPDGTTSDRDTDSDTLSDPLAESITISEAIERGILTGKYETVKKRIQRADDKETPKPVGSRGRAHLYKVGDLIEFCEKSTASQLGKEESE